MKKQEALDLLAGTVDDITPELAKLSPADRQKLAQHERDGKNRTTLIDAIDALGDAPAIATESGGQVTGKPASEGDPSGETSGGATTDQATVTPETQVPVTNAGQGDAAVENGQATGEGSADAMAASRADARAATAETIAAQAVSRADGLEQELAPHRNSELERDGDKIENLEQRLRDASAVEPVEKIRGLIAEYGLPFGVELADGEDTPTLVLRFLVAADEMRVAQGNKTRDLEADVLDLTGKLETLRRKKDPGAVKRDRTSTRVRPAGDKFEPLQGDDGEQSPLDKILLGGEELELVFSNGTNELTEFAPYSVRGNSFERVGGGWRLREAIVLKGASGEVRVRGAALLRDGKQIAWSSFIEPVRIPTGQEVNFDKMIVFK